MFQCSHPIFVNNVHLSLVLPGRREAIPQNITLLSPFVICHGIGLSLVGSQKGYRVKIVMPENMSEERKKIIAAFGAELVLTPAEESVEGCLKKVREIKEADPTVYIPQQFENPDNPLIHYLTTGPEILKDLNHVDIFISGLGSGGTLAGVGRYLKEQNPQLKVVAVEPKNVSALLGHEPGLHKIQGIGDGFIPAVLDPKMVDEVVEVTDDDATETARWLARTVGTLVGTSSGANVWATKQMVKKFGNNEVIATVLPDRAERYFSTALI